MKIMSSHLHLLDLPSDIRSEIVNKLYTYEVYLLSLTCKGMRKLSNSLQIHKDIAKFAPVSIIDYMINTCSYRIPLNTFIVYSIEGDNYQVFQSLLETRWKVGYFDTNIIMKIWKLVISHDSVNCFKFVDYLMGCKLSLFRAIEQGIKIKCFAWLLENRYVDDNYIRDILNANRYDLLTYICKHKLVKDKLHLIYAIATNNERFTSIICEYYPELAPPPKVKEILTDNSDLLTAIDIIMNL